MDVVYLVLTVFYGGVETAKTTIELEKCENTVVWVGGVAFSVQRCYSHIKVSTAFSVVNLYTADHKIGGEQTVFWTQDPIEYDRQMSYSVEIDDDDKSE